MPPRRKGPAQKRGQKRRRVDENPPPETPEPSHAQPTSTFSQASSHGSVGSFSQLTEQFSQSREAPESAPETIQIPATQYTNTDSDDDLPLSTAPSDPSAPTELQKTNQDSVEARDGQDDTFIQLTDYSWVVWDQLPLYAKPLDERRTVNWVWNHGVPIVSKNRADTTKYWLCKRCFLTGSPRTFMVNRGVHGPQYHLRNHHSIAPESAEKFDYHAWFQKIGLDPSSPVHQPIIEKLLAEVNIDDAFNAYRRYVILAHVPFSSVESPAFRAFCEVLQPRTLAPKSIPSRRTFTRRILQDFRNSKTHIRAYLRTIAGLLHIAFDLWTSPNLKAMNGIVTHFWDHNIDENNLRNCLLALSPMMEAHTGKNIAKDVARAIKDYSISDKIGYFVLDNASNNDTALEELGKLLGKSPQWVKHRRLRCLGHIMNLIARALLFGEEKNIWEAQSQLQTSCQGEVQLWRKLGPIGKLHNLVKWVKKSPQRHERFLRVVQYNRKKEGRIPVKLTLLQNNNTRWNSTFTMIDRAIILRSEIGEFIVAETNRYQHKLTSGQRTDPKPEDSLSRLIFENPLTAEDWQILTEYRRLLEPLVDATMQLQGVARTKWFLGIGHVIPTIEYILLELEDAKTRFEHCKEKHCLAAIEYAWSKANEYYNKLDESPAYAAGIVLDPRWKWSYFKEQWKETPSWIQHSQAQVRELWRSEYKSLTSSQISPAAFNLPRPAGEPQSRMGKMFDEISKRIYVSDSEEDDDEYEAWIAERPIRTDPLVYWRSPAIQRSFPRLCRMALDIFSIPCMSDEPERIFSLAGLLVTKRRNRLGCNIIEASECLGDWDRHDFTRICMTKSLREKEDSDGDSSVDGEDEDGEGEEDADTEMYEGDASYTLASLDKAFEKKLHFKEWMESQAVM